MLYQFNEYEWAELLQLTDFYRTLIPDFLWDALQNYFINHGNNKSIETIFISVIGSLDIII